MKRGIMLHKMSQSKQNTTSIVYQLQESQRTTRKFHKIILPMNLETFHLEEHM